MQKLRIIVFIGCLAFALTAPAQGDWLLGYRHEATTEFKFHGETKDYARAIFLRLGETKARIDDGPSSSCIIDLETQTTYFLYHRKQFFERHPHPLTLEGLMSRNEKGKKLYELSRQMRGGLEIRSLEPLPSRVKDSGTQLSHRLTVHEVTPGSGNEEDYSAWLTTDLPLSDQQIQLYKALRSSCAARGPDSDMNLWLDAALAPDAVTVEFELTTKDRFNETQAHRKLMEIREVPPDPALYRPPADYEEREFKPEEFMSIQIFKDGKKTENP